MKMDNRGFVRKTSEVLTGSTMQSMLMDMPVAVYGCDEKGIITFFNNAAACLWQIEPAIGEDAWYKVWKLYRPDGAELLSDEFPLFRTLKLQACHTGEEVIAERPDSTKRHLIICSYPLFDENGLLTGGYETVMDVTDQKMEVNRQTMIASVIDSAEDAIIVKDLRGTVISWNASAAKLFGYDASDIIGKHISILLPKGRKSEETEIMERIGQGENIRHYETMRSHKSGKQIPISLTISPVKNDRGEIIGASKIAREITQEVAVRKMLELHNKELKQESQYKDQFLSLASHELKTPLTSAKAYAQLILHYAADDPKKNNLASKTLLNLNRMEKLINGLLDISRIKVGKMAYEIEELNIRDVIINTVEDVSQLSEGRSIRINQLDEACVKGDRVRLEQVMINLLNNAIKYSPDGDAIEVAVKKEARKAVISVRDHGIGIPPQSINLLFDRYYRVDSSANNFPGLGLGLFIAAEILRKHGGNYWVESTLGKGSVFYFSLPLC